MPFLTPDNMPGDVSRHVSINRALLPVLMGALYECSIEDNWEKFGTMDPSQCAGMFLEALENMQEYQVGAIVPTLGSLPAGCLWCDGGAYPIADYPLLAANLPPTLLNGDFIVLPDLNGVFLRGGGVVGEVGGESEHTLTLAEIPPHNHGEHTHLSGQATGELPTPVPDLPIPQPFSDRGGGQPHNNLPPFFTVRFYVVAK